MKLTEQRLKQIIRTELQPVQNSVQQALAESGLATEMASNIEVSPGGGTSDHGALTGLGDDDHSQYHTDARGDARYSGLSHNHDSDYAAVSHSHDDLYYTESETDTLLNGKSDTGHAHGDLYYTETETDALLASKAAEVHSHAASEITSGTFSDARVAETNVTQHEAALTVTESQISDLGSYITGIDKAAVEAVLTGEISTHSHAGGGGSGATPAHELVFEGTLDAAHNTNTNADVSWNDTENHSDVTHTNGDAVITLAAGEYDLYFNLEVTDGAANNRQTWALDVRHRNAADTELFTYRMASASYIRDDAATYDTGLCAGHFNLIVAAGEDITIQTSVLDAQTGAGVNNADTSVSYLRILKKTYT